MEQRTSFSSSLKPPSMASSASLSLQTSSGRPYRAQQSHSLRTSSSFTFPSDSSSLATDVDAASRLQAKLQVLSVRCYAGERGMRDLEERLKLEMARSRALTKDFGQLNDKIQHHNNLVNRASNVYIPYISSKLVEARELSEEAQSRLPEIRNDLQSHGVVYEANKRKAVHLHVQLAWLVSRWHVKLIKVMTLQVTGKRRKLFRIVLPLAIVVAVLIVILLMITLVIYPFLPIFLPRLQKLARLRKS